jgi:dolichol-phosphate mannosyltransferase
MRDTFVCAQKGLSRYEFVILLLRIWRMNLVRQKPEIAVVIPVYKADDCLEELYRRLVSSLELVTSNFEVLLVEDCGGDRSWEIICELAERDPRIKGVQLTRNFGQHYAITAGLDHCFANWVVVMDCDLQDKPEEIPRLYAKAQEGYDVVLANRGARRDPLPKRMTSFLFYKIFSYLADIDYDGQAGNFRIISFRVVESFRRMREQLRFFGGLVHWMGFSTATIEVTHDERFSGETSYTFMKLIKLATETVIAYSDKPLRLSIKFGFGISFFAFIYGVYIGIRSIVYGSPLLGWPSLIVSIYFMGGVIVGILGIIGIYLGKTYDESKRRPLYLVSKQTFDETELG